MTAINGSPHYASAYDFRRALEDRLKREAKSRGRPLEELRREFVFQRFLALIFAQTGSQWVLKGGASLLMRLVDARSSKGLDLLRLGEAHPNDAIAEIRQLTAPKDGDHLAFVVGDAVSYSRVNPVVEISVTAYIGAQYGSFPIDLATELHLLAKPELIRPRPVVEIPGLPEVRGVVVYPLTDQVADKVCAMYEVHGERQRPSSRFRDLFDLALIVSACEFDAGPVVQSLHAESERRRMQLPTKMTPPGPNWDAGYRAYARKTRITADLHDLTGALEHVGGCLNPLLAGSRGSGRWLPTSGWVGGVPLPNGALVPPAKRD